jgi:hypothetical protein
LFVFFFNYFFRKRKKILRGGWRLDSHPKPPPKAFRQLGVAQRPSQPLRVGIRILSSSLELERGRFVARISLKRSKATSKPRGERKKKKIYIQKRTLSGPLPIRHRRRFLWRCHPLLPLGHMTPTAFLRRNSIQTRPKVKSCGARAYWRTRSSRVVRRWGPKPDLGSTCYEPKS